MSASSPEEQLSKRCTGAEGQISLLLNSTPRDAAQLIFFSAEGILGAFTPDKQNKGFFTGPLTVSLCNLSHHECFLTVLQLESYHCLHMPLSFSLGRALLRLIRSSSVRAVQVHRMMWEQSTLCHNPDSQPLDNCLGIHRPPASATFPHRDVFASTAHLGTFAGVDLQSIYLGETNT